jgi:photosystem II stability/assembly factor-like uncharacterized protein
MSDPTPSQSPIETEDNQPLSPSSVGSLTFVDKQHGWVLGFSPLGELFENPGWVYSMASSDDGGTTWQSIQMPLKLSSEPDTVADIFFSNAQTGWFFYYTGSTSITGLYFTQDGGQTWKEEAPLGSIHRMARAADGNVWAFELDDCQCKWRFLLVTEAAYASWTEAKLKPPEEVPSPDQIVIADEMTAWAPKWNLVSEDDGESIYYSILSTRNGGTNWMELSTPCGPYIPGTSYFASHVVLDNQRIWLGCGRAGGAGAGAKYIYFSSDGGLSWQLRGKAGPSSDEEDTLSISGYLSTFHALSSNFVYMTWDRSANVILTKDGGMNWEYSLPLCSSEKLDAYFIDSESGWAFTGTWDFAHTCINRTIDAGATWQCVLLPENEPCSLQ